MRTVRASIAVLALLLTILPATPAFAARPSLRIGDKKVTEGTGQNVTAGFTLRLSRAASRPVLVAYVTASGTAKGGSDFIAKSGTLKFRAGQTKKVAKVAILGDARDEPTESFKVVITDVIGARIADKSGVGTIVDNDPTPTLAVGDEVISEPSSGAANMPFTVQLSAPSGRPVSFHYTTEYGTAEPGDFVGNAGDATIPAGSTSTTVNVAILNDDLHEDTEGFTLVLSNVVNGLVPSSPATGSIQDSDPFGVDSAFATSPGQVVVTFNGDVATGSVNLNGSQFAFDNGLDAIGASVSGNQVTVTTSPQSSATYTVTVGPTVISTTGAAAAPGENTAQFSGFEVAAELRLNEVSPAITNSDDLIELRVVSGGSLEGMRVEMSNPTVLATLPNISVATNDIIVIHLGTSYQSHVPASETTAKDQFPNALHNRNYDNAWDVMGSTTGITFSDRTLTIFDGANQIVDAAAFTDPNGTGPVNFAPSLAALQGAGEWLPADCGGLACDYTSTPTSEGISVSWQGTGTTSVGNTVQRLDNTDDNNMADWGPASTQTLGVLNVGQS